MFAASKSGSAEATDAQFNYVTMLLHGDGTNGAQNNTFLDSSTNNFTITRNGNTTQGTFTPYGSNWSNYFNGSSYFQIASTSVMNMNTYACVECWVNLSSSGANQLHVGRDSNYWVAYSFSAIGGSANKFVFSIYNGSAWSAVSSSTSPAVGTWYHVAGIRSGSTLQIYINGVLETTGTLSGTATTSATPIGIADNQGTSPMTGYLSNVRVNLGSTSAVLPYTANFTPSTVPLTAVTGTQLLTCQSSRFVDNSTNALSLPIGGSPSVQRFSPFSPTSAYSTSVIGGSMYLDGTTDFVKTPSDVNLSSTLLASNFTIECWIYLAAYPSSGAAIWTNSVTNADGFTSSYINSNGTVGTGKVNVNEFNTTTTIKLNTWTHFALVRNSGTLYVYFNGVQDATTGAASTYLNTSATKPMQIGSSNQSPPTAMQGYMSDFRVVASAVYTTGFTPNTAPLTAISGTNLLLSTTNAGILDNAMMNDLETVGNAQISTSVKKYGTGSLAFDGSGDYLSILPTRQLDFGTGNFTLEMWLNLNTVSTAQVFVNFGFEGAPYTQRSFVLYLTSSNVLQFAYSTDGSSLFDTSLGASGITTGTWNHLAIVRNGSTITAYRNGTAYATTINIGTSPIAYAGGLFRIGTDATNYTNGYIDDLRITKGVARYTATFTPPTTAFADKG